MSILLSSSSSPSSNTPQSRKHSSLLVLLAPSLFLFFVIISLPTLKIHSDAADVAGIAKWSLAMRAIIGNSYSLLAQYLKMLVSLFISCCFIYFLCLVLKSVVPCSLKRSDSELWSDSAFWELLASASAACNPSSCCLYLAKTSWNCFRIQALYTFLVASW